MGYSAAMQPSIKSAPDAPSMPCVAPIGRVPRIPKPYRGSVAAIPHAFVWLCPWLTTGFVGFRATILGLMPRPYTWSAVRHWKSGRNRVPADVARAIAAAVRDKAERGLQLAAELDAYADAEEARPKRRCGFLRVEEDGNFRR